MFKTMMIAFVFSFFLMLHGTIYKSEQIPIEHDNHVYLFKEIANADVLCFKNEDCRILAEASYYESRNQPDEGMLAVMQTVINRVEHQKWPNSVKEVVYDGCQFSYTCDGSKGKRKSNVEQWQRSYRLAYMFLKGYKRVDTGGSTHYHASSVRPRWAKEFRKTAVVGDHIFYNCDGKNC